jgi:hypothetical protein
VLRRIDKSGEFSFPRDAGNKLDRSGALLDYRNPVARCGQIMDAPLTAIELTGTIDEQHRLLLDDELPVSGPKRVRVIVLYPLDDSWDETEWLRAGASNQAFADLTEPGEDIYSPSDGKPFHDEA